MTQAVGETLVTAAAYKCSYRTAAFVNAIKKIEVTYREAGITMG